MVAIYFIGFKSILAIQKEKETKTHQIKKY